MDNAYKLKTISNLLSKNINDMSGVPHPCQYSDLCKTDPTESCDESAAWIINLDMKIPIWSRLYPSNCVGHSRELRCTRERNYNVEIPQRLYSLWGSADTHSLVAEKMWGLERFQWVCNVLICCAALKYNLNEWSSNLLDDIVYRGSLLFAQLCQKHNLSNREFRMKHMCTFMQFRNTNYKVQIEEKSKGFLYIPYGFNEYNLARALTSFFQYYQFGMLECGQRCLAFGFATDVDQGYFMYDCQYRGEPFVNERQANACVLRTNHLQILLYCMIVALNVSVDNVRFKIFNVDVRIDDPKERRARRDLYEPTLTSPVSIYPKNKQEYNVGTGNEQEPFKDNEHKNVEKTNLIAADERFRMPNNKNAERIYEFKENNSKVEIGEMTIATISETTPFPKNLSELSKMQQQIQNQGDFQVILPPRKNEQEKSLLNKIEGDEGMAVPALNSDSSKSNISYRLPEDSYKSSTKTPPAKPIKFRFSRTSPKDIKKIFDKIRNENENQEKLRPHTDFSVLQTRIQTIAELESKSNHFYNKITSDPNSFGWSLFDSERQHQSLSVTDSMETLKPANSCIIKGVKCKEYIKKETLTKNNSRKHTRNMSKSISSKEKPYLNLNIKVSFGSTLKAPKQKRRSLKTGATKKPHLAVSKLSSAYGSKNQLLSNQKNSFKTRSDLDLIELYDVTKPNALGIKVYLVNNRPENAAYNDAKTIPKNIRVVRNMF